MNYVKGILSKIKTKRSPLDVSDFVSKRPAPGVADLWDRVDAHYMGNTMDRQLLEVHKKRMFFDMKYRCGAEGRCLEGDYRCRFPGCFHLRPCFKGGDIFVERVGLENKVRHKNVDIVTRFLDKEELHSAVDALQQRIAEQQAKTSPADMAPAVREDWMDLVMLRATILVNAGLDAEAVNSLLEAAAVVPRPEQIECVSAATNWAVLNDMQVRFFKMHLQEFPDLVGAKPKAEQPEVLDKVVAYAQNDAELLAHVVNVVVLKEIAGVVSRAQNAQDYDDRVEDPIATTVLRDSVVYYKDVLGGTFWANFYEAVMMPPLDPKDDPPPSADGETPRHVLDALGRSMILHHIAKLQGDDTILNDPAAISKMTDEQVAAMPKSQRTTLKRMQQLLGIVKRNAERTTSAGIS